MNSQAFLNKPPLNDTVTSQWLLFVNGMRLKAKLTSKSFIWHNPLSMLIKVLVLCNFIIENILGVFGKVIAHKLWKAMNELSFNLIHVHNHTKTKRV